MPHLPGPIALFFGAYDDIILRWPVSKPAALVSGGYANKLYR